MAKKLMRGKDRRLLKKIDKVFALIEKRDLRALNPKKTTELSNRVAIFSTGDPTLTANVAAVRSAITSALNANAP